MVGLGLVRKKEFVTTRLDAHRDHKDYSVGRGPKGFPLGLLC